MKSIDLSIIIVNYNSVQYIQECLDSIYRTKRDLEIEVFVIDNASVDNSVQIIKEFFPQVHLIVNSENVGFSLANNQGLVLAKGRAFMLLNPDTVVSPDALQSLVAYLDEHPECGIVGPTLLDANQQPCHPLKYANLWNNLMHSLRITNVFYFLKIGESFVSGACLVLRANLIEQVGLLDEYLFWSEDADYCWRARKAGWQVAQIEQAHIVHVGGGSSSNVELVLTNQILSNLKFMRKHRPGFEVFFTKLIRLQEVLCKWAVWRAIDILHPSADARARNKSYKRLARLIFDFPTSRYNLEDYIYHPENLRKLLSVSGNQDA